MKERPLTYEQGLKLAREVSYLVGFNPERHGALTWVKRTDVYFGHKAWTVCFIVMKKCLSRVLTRMKKKLDVFNSNTFLLFLFFWTSSDRSSMLPGVFGADSEGPEDSVRWGHLDHLQPQEEEDWLLTLQELLHYRMRNIHRELLSPLTFKHLLYHHWYLHHHPFKQELLHHHMRSPQEASLLPLYEEFSRNSSLFPPPSTPWPPPLYEEESTSSQVPPLLLLWNSSFQASPWPILHHRSRSLFMRGGIFSEASLSFSHLQHHNLSLYFHLPTQST